MKFTGKILLAAVAVAALSGTAMAADLAMPAAAPEVVPPAAAAPTNWDGPYIGASVGYSWGTAHYVGDSSTDDGSPAGWLLGLQAGYNFHLSDQIVAGIQGNIDWTNETSSIDDTSDYSYTIGWDGAIVGRLGVDVGGSVLPYVEAGVAFANATINYDPSTYNATYTGWTVGAGVQFALADNLTADVNVRYADYGTATLDGSDISLNDTSVRLGIDYHF